MSRQSKWKASEQGPNRMPLVFLAYLIFCFVAPVQSHASWEKWALTSGGVLCFLALYLTAYLTKGPIARWSILGIVILACALAPVNPGIFGFFVYAAALLGFRFDIKVAYAAIAGLLAVMAIEGWVLQPGFWLWAILCRSRRSSASPTFIWRLRNARM